MDTIAVGKYLAQLRKEQNLTQEQLGEQLGVTNKTISRWENGNYMPPVEMLQQLSALYGVSINEILSGRKLPEEEYKAAAEDNLRTVLHSSSFTKKEQFAYFKKKWEKEHAFSMTLAMIVLIGAMVLCFFFWKDLILLPAIAGFAYSIHTNNQMMAYIEAHLYPDAKKKTEESTKKDA